MMWFGLDGLAWMVVKNDAPQHQRAIFTTSWDLASLCTAGVVK